MINRHINMIKSVLVTGATGFVGQELCGELLRRGFRVIAVIRGEDKECYTSFLEKHSKCNFIEIDSISGKTNWKGFRAGIDAVIHLAAHVHIASKNRREENLFREVNYFGTCNLAKAALDEGVKRFIFLSTIKVNGESSGKKPFTEKDSPNPLGPYAQSKWEAEEYLEQIADHFTMGVAILRPPLVYGPHVKGNFLRLLKLASMRLPMPLAGLTNKRSFISKSNLVDFIMTCLGCPDKINKLFLVSDATDASVAELLISLSHFLNKPSRLFKIPKNMLYAISYLLGRLNEFKQLDATLQIDSTKGEKMLGWIPSQSLQDGLKETCQWYMNL